MELNCLTWIPYVWSQLVNKKDIISLPDEVIVQILSKLPLQCVVKCRRVCKRWKALTSTPNFANLILKNSDTLVFMQNVKCPCMLHFFELNYPVSMQENLITKVQVPPGLSLKLYQPVLVGICNGLLLFRSKKYPLLCFVYNPIMQELIKICNPCPTGSFICGIFFQALTRVYNLLYAHRQRGGGYLYYVYTLNGCMNFRELSYFPYRPADSTTATTVNGNMYWITRQELQLHLCSDTIMAFNINLEEFDFISHPGNICLSSGSHEKMHLFEMNEQLAFGQVDSYNKFLGVWVLEDYTAYAWVRRYTISLYWNVEHYPYKDKCVKHNYDVKPLMIRKNEILLAWSLRGIFWFNLEDNTIMKVQSTWTEEEGVDPSNYEICDLHASAYTKTLVSLKNKLSSL